MGVFHKNLIVLLYFDVLVGGGGVILIIRPGDCRPRLATATVTNA